MFPSISYPLYRINLPKHWLVRDRPISKPYAPATEKLPHASMLFHVTAGDYITTLATILRFFEESIYDKKITPEMRELQLKTIRDVMSDLLYLDKHYVIVAKDLYEKLTQKY